MKKTIQQIGILCYLITTFSNAQEAIPAAEEIMDIAFQEAKEENKNVFLMFHASWCGWCHRMDDNMQNKACKEFFDTNYVITHLTVKENKENKHLENPGAFAFLGQLKGEKQGIPYWVIFDKKGKITLQTGYGPSGLPHIGTFAEVARTSMIVNALNNLTDLPKEIITFSDDMDGLRKIPDNVPNIEILKKNLGKSLTNIPDPFGKFSSFGEHNNEMLKSFLNKFNFNYNFKSSTQLYKSGKFNDVLVLILNKYQEIINIVIPTLGKERQKTYSPFLPICPETGKVLEIPMLEIIKDKKRLCLIIREKKLK